MQKLTNNELRQLSVLLWQCAHTAQAQQMRGFIQHGCVTTRMHCVRVAAISFWLNRRLRLGADEPSLVRGAFLHDFYLYDWHQPHAGEGLHGFTHPATALQNAEACFALNRRERNIIRSHMWPLTLAHPPLCREAAIVCLADKISAVGETLLERRARRAAPAAAPAQGAFYGLRTALVARACLLLAWAGMRG